MAGISPGGSTAILTYLLAEVAVPRPEEEVFLGYACPLDRRTERTARALWRWFGRAPWRHAGWRPRFAHAGSDAEPATEVATQPATESAEPTLTTHHAALRTTTLTTAAKTSSSAQPATAISATRGAVRLSGLSAQHPTSGPAAAARLTTAPSSQPIAASLSPEPAVSAAAPRRATSTPDGTAPGGPAEPATVDSTAPAPA